VTNVTAEMLVSAETLVTHSTHLIGCRVPNRKSPKAPRQFGLALSVPFLGPSFPPSQRKNYSVEVRTDLVPFYYIFVW